MSEILRLGLAGKLPLRIVHNDTKFNNVLLDSNDQAQCVIDLDTVMPGYVAYDFGNSVRTIINTVAEDEADTGAGGGGGRRGGAGAGGGGRGGGGGRAGE